MVEGWFNYGVGQYALYVFCWDLLKDYVMKLMVFNVCVLLEFIEKLYIVIDGFQCVCSAGNC